jgi:hypothetical protein
MDKEKTIFKMGITMKEVMKEEGFKDSGNTFGQMEVIMKGHL